jgi:hypothetical protein
MMSEPVRVLDFYFHDRPTMTRGKVRTFASCFGSDHKAVGPFEISVSRDELKVYRAELRTPHQVIRFREALGLAAAYFEGLQR